MKRRNWLPQAAAENKVSPELARSIQYDLEQAWALDELAYINGIHVPNYIEDGAFCIN